MASIEALLPLCQLGLIQFRETYAVQTNEMSEPLLRIRNHHAPVCGDPPIVSSDNPSAYIGYFENAYGEQWIFTYSRTTKVAVLRGGDAGWNKEFAIHDGVAPGLVLNNAESMWLAACWLAATVT